MGPDVRGTTGGSSCGVSRLTSSACSSSQANSSVRRRPSRRWSSVVYLPDLPTWSSSSLRKRATGAACEGRSSRTRRISPMTGTSLSSDVRRTIFARIGVSGWQALPAYRRHQIALADWADPRAIAGTGRGEGLVGFELQAPPERANRRARYTAAPPASRSNPIARWTKRAGGSCRRRCLECPRWPVLSAPRAGSCAHRCCRRAAGRSDRGDCAVSAARP